MFLTSQKFRWKSLGLLLCTAILYAIEDTLMSSFILWLLFSPLSYSDKNPGTELTPCLVSDFSGCALNFCPFPVMFATVLWHIAYTMLRYAFLTFSVYRAFCMKGSWVLPKVFGWPVISVLLSTLVKLWIYWFVCVKSTLHFRYKANYLMIDLFDVFLNLIGKYLIGKFREIVLCFFLTCLCGFWIKVMLAP